jgi:predicted enzyme related to lactoylglutathione lyase
MLRTIPFNIITIFTKSRMNRLGRVIILVHHYDEAFAFYERSFGFRKIVDYTTENGQRFLHIGAGGENDAGIWFLKADTEEQMKRVGNQTGGQPALVIYTSSLEDLHRNLELQGVKIKAGPVLTRPYKFLHCYDLYGNEIIVVQLEDGNVENHA